MVKEKTIEETYQKLTQREHILLRNGMYIGDIKKNTEELWVINDNKMVKQFVEYSPGFMKIFDEILSNATDHAIRDPTVNKIEVSYSKDTGEISVYNNGSGVPVVLHKEHNMYVPELIFGNLLSGSNYNDNETRTTVGTNGLGGKATNIFSKKFIVETVDSENKKKFIQEFSNNMSDKTKPKITSAANTKSYTKITFIPDYNRFSMENLEDDTILLIKKRVYDCIANTKAHVNLYLNGEKIKGKSFTDYIKYYFDDSKIISEQNIQTIKGTEFIWEYAIVPSDHYEQVSFVNGNCTYLGGKHVDYILYQIINKIKDLLETKKKLVDVKSNFIKDKFCLFLKATIINPSFNSQTKETLTTQVKDFGCKVEVTENFINKIYKSSIIDEIVEFCKLKESSNLAKASDGKKVNKVYISKLEDANDAGTAKSDQCTLILTEGLSALTFALHGRSIVGADKYGAFPLRGKLLNTKDATISQLIGNEEINNIKQILGLKQDKKYKNISELRYGKVMILTDADSVTGDTPLLLKDKNNNILTETIEKLTNNFTKNEFNNKEYGNTELEIWTEKGWTKINSIIRHKVEKNIYRVLTHTGVVDVTEDHSLLKDNSDEIRPIDCNINDKLLHSFPIFNEHKINIPDNLEGLHVKELWKYASECKIPYYQSYKKIDLIKELNIINSNYVIDLNNINTINKNEAYVMGLWWADGSSGIYNRKNKNGYESTFYYWAINNTNLEFLTKAKDILEKLYKLTFKIVECKKKNNSYKQPYKLLLYGGKNTKNYVENYNNTFYYRNNNSKFLKGNKYIPKEILNSTKKIRESFLIGYYNGDGEGHNLYVNSKRCMDIDSKISANSIFILCKSLGYEVSINNNNTKPNILRLIITKGHQQWDKSKIKKIINLGKTEQYVYDLETENHHFQAGVGQLIVHNTDGSHIKALFVNFIHTFWPELLKINSNFIQTLKTPIVKAIKGKKVLEFFTEQDYLVWKESGINVNSYQIRYFKGLGTSTKEDAKDTFKRFNELKVDYYYKDNKCDKSILLAFEKDKNIKTKKKSDDDTESDDNIEVVKCTDRRKNWLSNYDKSIYINVNENKVSYQDLINKELIHFSIYDNLRSIPSLCDGLKPSQRKILYYLLKKNPQLIKVAQLSGYVSAETGYHHGEVSLQGAIIGLAQNFVGTNNINILYPEGNFGTRFFNGKDASSPRYIFTRLSDITHLIFNKYDLPLLDYLNDDGILIEPEWYLPIIPMVLVNGCEGIGTGYSTYVPTYNPIDIIVNLIKMIDDEDFQPNIIKPYFKGFNGQIQEFGGGSFVTKGKWEKLSDTQIKITELPVGMGVTIYKEFLESLIINNISKKNDKSKTKKKKYELKNVQNKTKDENDDICFIVEFNNASILSELVKNNLLEKELKLTKSFSTNNMYLFNEKLILTKYDTPIDILCEFFDIRIEYYEKRKIYIIKKLKEELKYLEAKSTFIKEYIDGILDINKKTKEFINNLLEKRKYPTQQNTYDYLLKLPIYSLTLEKINDLHKQCEIKRKELEFYKITSSSQLWKTDLEELHNQLNQM